MLHLEDSGCSKHERDFANIESYLDVCSTLQVLFLLWATRKAQWRQPPDPMDDRSAAQWPYVISGFKDCCWWRQYLESAVATNCQHVYIASFQDCSLLFQHAGGPGCSSELAVFYENGPFHIKKDLTLTPNPYGWDNAGSIIFVDQVSHQMVCQGCALHKLMLSHLQKEALCLSRGSDFVSPCEIWLVLWIIEEAALKQWLPCCSLSTQASASLRMSEIECMMRRPSLQTC